MPVTAGPLAKFKRGVLSKRVRGRKGEKRMSEAEASSPPLTLTMVPEYGYVLGVAAGMFTLQQLLLLLPVIRQRIKTGIHAPTLYPRDVEIKKLNLSDEQVKAYMCAQRAHQNLVEFNSAFLPLFLATGLIPAITRKVALAGAWTLLCRFLMGVGYQFNMRHIGALYSLGSFYILYLAFTQAYELVKSVSVASRIQPARSFKHAPLIATPQDALPLPSTHADRKVRSWKFLIDPPLL